MAVPSRGGVLLTLTLKKLPYESKLVSFAKGEHKSEAFLALNPRGKVPVITDGDLALYESTAILGYLDRAYPEPPLYGHTPLEAAKIYRLVAEHEAYVEHVAHAIINPLYFGKEKEHSDDIVDAQDALLPSFSASSRF